MIFKTNMPNHGVSIRKHSVMKPMLRNKKHNAVKPKRYENMETWNHGLVLF